VSVESASTESPLPEKAAGEGTTWSAGKDERLVVKLAPVIAALKAL
jgi:hypothetical protein